MANKSVYQEYNQDALKHFNLEESPFYGVFSSNEIHDVLITQDVTIFEKVRDILSNNTNATVDLSNYKKAFILPKCPVSSDRIKEACKEHKITVTNDYEKADFIITHDEFYKKFRDGEKILTSMTMYKLWNYEAFPGTNGYVEFVDEYHKTTGKSVLWDLRMDEFRSSYRIDDPESLYDECVLPGLAINLAHLVDTNELDVVDVDDMLCQSANKIELTESLVDDISGWMQSYNQENYSLVAKVLPTIRSDKSPHLLWQLAQNIYNQMYRFSRDKDVQYWLENANIGKLYHYTAQSMILHLEKEEKLDVDSFRYLEPIVRKQISIHNRDLYVFKVHVKPEYGKYLKKKKDD